MLQLRLHDSEVAERISNDGMNGEAVQLKAVSVSLQIQKD